MGQYTYIFQEYYKDTVKPINMHISKNYFKTLGDQYSLIFKNYLVTLVTVDSSKEFSNKQRFSQDSFKPKIEDFLKNISRIMTDKCT